MKPVIYKTYYIEYNDHGLDKCVSIVGQSFNEVIKSFEEFFNKKGYEIVSVNLRATGYMYV